MPYTDSWYFFHKLPRKFSDSLQSLWMVLMVVFQVVYASSTWYWFINVLIKREYLETNLLLLDWRNILEISFFQSCFV
jgi:hypothetical protein